MILNLTGSLTVQTGSEASINCQFQVPKLNMSDWEDEYDKDGVAVENKPAPKSAAAHYKVPRKDSVKAGNVDFGGRKLKFGGGSRESKGDPRGGWDNACLGLEFRSRRPRDREDKRSEIENSDSSAPVIITVENASVGRIIGMIF